MSKLTRDEYYDLLVKTSEKGGFPARGVYGLGCYYLTSDGRKCAIGLLIPDGHIMQKRECNVHALADDFRDEFWKYVPDGMRINELLAIQNAHDDMKPWDHGNWVEGITRIKEQYAGAN